MATICSAVFLQYFIYRKYRIYYICNICDLYYCDILYIFAMYYIIAI